VRILMIIHQFMPEFSSGTERFTLSMAKMHQRNGHHVDVLTCSIGDGSLWNDEWQGLRRAVVDGIRVFGIPRTLLGQFAEIGVDSDRRSAPLIDSFVDQGNYDVAHVTHSMRMLSVIEAVRKRSIPYVITLTDFFSICYRINLKRKDGAFCAGPEQGQACQRYCATSLVTREILGDRRSQFSSLLFAASCVVACSDFVATIFKREFPDLPIRTLDHGIDLLRFSIRRRADNNAPIVFGFIGTLSEAKGVHVLTEAFVRAAPANARLELVGPTHYDKALVQRLKNTRNNNISIKEGVDHQEVPRVLADFDVLCLPSLVPEAGSLALREAFATGLPALVSDVGWPADVVAKLGCGRVIPVGDVDAWAHAIREISADPSALIGWTENVPMQLRLEEESFFYEQFYRHACTSTNEVNRH
jgi:glycosyltransferase involved in cell wall biosynthesis